MPGGVLLATKLHVPPARSSGRAVIRSRLLDQVTEGLAGRLTLLSAPAGYGKTTLLGEWLSTYPCPAAWISLDAGDNDPVCFISYLAAALSTIVPAVGEAVGEMVRVSGSLPVEPILTVLINEMTASEAMGDPSNSSFALVLDDYHVIDNSAIHQAITFLIDHLPSQLHLVMATRVDPPLPLARWRSRDQMVEVRADDLRFDDNEAVVFLNQVMQLDLLPEDVNALVDHTEGWVVGLQMAALSLRGRPAERVAAFIQTFSGSHRYVLDYLVEEVFDHQPEKIQDFLLQTSILERLNGPLCSAVTGQAESQVILEYLERANLFVVPLDEERQWYRYHHLFAQLLYARLQQSDPELARTLHSRAAEWSQDNGRIAEAVNHALAAQDYQHASQWIEQEAFAMLARGEVMTFLSWLHALPADVVSSRPWLCIYHAWTLSRIGRLNHVESLLQQAEAHAPLGASEAITRELYGWLSLVRANLANLRGEVSQATEQARLAHQCLGSDSLACGTVGFPLGYAYYASGDLETAGQIWSQVFELAKAPHAFVHQRQ